MNDTMVLDPIQPDPTQSEAQVVESTRDYQVLVSDRIVDRTYLAIDKLKYFDPADPWYKETIEMPQLGITENDGVILHLRGTARKSMKGDGSFEQVALTELGEEISEIEADRRQGIVNRPFPRYKTYEWRIYQVTETDGPELRAELLQSFEQWKQDEKKQKLEDMSASKDLASAMRDFAQNLKGGQLTEQQVLSQALDKMTPEMLIHLAEEKKSGSNAPLGLDPKFYGDVDPEELKEEPKRRGWPKGKLRGKK